MLSRGEAKFESLLEAAPDAMVGVDQSGVIRFVNRQTELLFGYDRDRLVGQPIETLVPESFREVHPTHRAGYLANPDTRAMGAGLELTGRRQDGTEFPVDVSLSSIETEEGLWVTAAVRDASQQKQAFDAARSMIEASLDSLVSISPEGKITDVNEALIKVTGAARQELIGAKFSDYFTEPDKAEEIYQRVFAEGMAVDYPLTIRHRDGTLTEVLYNASVYRDAKGNVLGVFAAARDVTTRKQAFDAARSMIEASLDSLVSISPEGKITDVNEATTKATGVPREKLIGTAFSDYFTEPDKANEVYQRVFAEGMAVDYPLTIRRPDGTLTDVLYNASVYRDAQGNVLGVFAAARDVTQQKLAQVEIAEQLARELERLAELERFQRLTVGRELKMIELKKEIESLRRLAHADGGNALDQR